MLGGDARCDRLLQALRELIRDYEPPADPSRQLAKDLLQRINKHVDFLLKFRPQAASMGNATRFIKIQVGKLPQDAGTEWAKHRKRLIEALERFQWERVTVAGEETAANACDKVADGDVVLCYCYSEVVVRSLLMAREQGTRFSVVVVDSRPRMDGTKVLRVLTEAGISCQYVDVAAISYIMREATKVFIGASAVLANGSVYARAGSALIALVAKDSSVPVIVLAETNKFHERVQLDSITANELFDPRDLLKFSHGGPDAAQLRDVESLPKLTLLNLNYDLMPADLVAVVATEAGLIPATSVPVILREFRKDLQANFGH